MHACGHDAHTAILLCLAQAAAEDRYRIKGKVLPRRCFSESVRENGTEHIRHIAQSVCAMRGCACVLAFDSRTPCVVNAEKETKLACRQSGSWYIPF